MSFSPQVAFSVGAPLIERPGATVALAMLATAAQTLSCRAQATIVDVCGGGGSGGGVRGVCSVAR